MTGSFNLIDEPWILTADHNGRTVERSISELLSSPEEFATIRGDIPTQQFAITRLLLAIVRRAIAWGDDPVATWGDLWKARALPQDQIGRYLERYRHRFDLLDDDEPFYQVAEFLTTKNNINPIGLLISDLPPKYQYFTTRAGSEAEGLSLAETARWVVHAQAYDPSGIKTGAADDPRTKGGKGYPIGISWAGQLGGVLLEGRTLTETLLLNTVLLNGEESTLNENDRPAWERPHPGTGVRDDPIPSGQADLLTWQSRRIFIAYRGDRAVGAIVGNGDPLESHRQRNREFLTGWRYSQNKSKQFGEKTYYPRTFDSDRPVWEGIEALLVDTEQGSAGFAPGVVHWLDFLVDEGLIARDEFAAPHVFGLRYDNNASVVGAAIDDRIKLRITNFGHDGCRRDAIDAVRTADAVANAIGALAEGLASAAGGEGTGQRASARSQFLAALDTPYRGWVTRLGAEDSDTLRTEWHQRVYQIATAKAEELIRNAGRPAFLGRYVDVGGKERWVDTASAMSAFRRSLARELPGAIAQETESAQ